MTSSCDILPCWLSGNFSDCGVVISNPDIAGPGIITAYFTSAVLGVIALVLAYITDSIPSWYYNEVDKYTIFERSGSLRFAKWATNVDRKKRVESFERFVLALGDQQLVTGISLVISAVALPYKTTYYDFSIVTSLAWFSSTIHLITLNMLWDYFIQHRRLRNFRIFGMLVMLALLIMALVTSHSMRGSYPGTPLVCIFPHMNRGQGRVPGASILLIVFLFANAITSTHRRFDNLGYTIETMLLPTRYLILPFVQSRARPLVRQSSNYAEMFVFMRSQDWWLAFSGQKKGSWSITTLSSAYIMGLGGITFCLGHGFALFLSSTYPHIGFGSNSTWSGITQGTNEFGFGQLLPILLLLLPFFTATESFLETRDHLASLQQADTNIQARYQDANRITPESTDDIRLVFTTNFQRIKKHFHVELLALLRNRPSSSSAEFPSTEDMKILVMNLPLAEQQASIPSPTNKRRYSLFLLIYTGVPVVGGVGIAYTRFDTLSYLFLTLLCIIYMVPLYRPLMTLVHLTPWGMASKRNQLIEVMEATPFLSAQNMRATDSKHCAVSTTATTKAVALPSANLLNTEPVLTQFTTSVIV